MKVLFVDDNRENPNWGCRATTHSLLQLIKRKYEVIGTIKQKLAVDPHPIGFPLLHYLDYKYFRGYLLKRILKKPFIQKFLGIIPDYMSPDPSESIRNLLKYKNRDPQLSFIYEKVRAADAVILNGEGCMIFTTPPRRDLLFQLMIIDLATTHFHKPVFYVNAMASDCPVNGRNQETAKFAVNSLSRCRTVTFRDYYSVKLFNKLTNNVNHMFKPDALFSWYGYFQNNNGQLPSNGDFVIPFVEEESLFGKFNFNTPYICIGGSSLAAKYPKDAIQPYCDLVNRLKMIGMPVYLIQTCVGDSFLQDVSNITNVPLLPVRVPILLGGAVLANARVFISGRFHPSIFASLGGTPCIFLGSNSHKTLSLQQVLEYDAVKEFPVIPKADDIEGIYHMAQEILKRGDEIRSRIRAVSKKLGEEAITLLDVI